MPLTVSSSLLLTQYTHIEYGSSIIQTATLKDTLRSLKNVEMAIAKLIDENEKARRARKKVKGLDIVS